MRSFFSANKQVFLYGICLAALLFLLRWLELRYLIIDHAIEVYVGFIALIFTGLGVWLALRLARPRVKTIVIEKTVEVPERPFILNEAELGRLGLSRRELDVLQQMSKGLSNQEIAEQLFVSLSTVKTHSSNLFEKLGVKRRTQAIEKAKRLNIIQ